MPCAEGYPKSPCPFGYEGRITRLNCGACKHYIPPPHILAWCMLWDRDRVLCKLPKSACETCPEKAPRGAVRDGLTDWTDPASVKLYYEKRRKENPSEAAEAMMRFLERRPDYFKEYREKHREKIREAQRRYYRNKKERRRH